MFIAQTWSEHCKHKIFAADIEYTDETGKRQEISSLYKTFIKAATEKAAKYDGPLRNEFSNAYRNLMDAANMIENEKVQIVNVNNGTRIETYLIKGKRGSGTCCLNGPAARQGAVGDIVIVISYARMNFETAKTFKPWIVFPREGNRL